MDAGDDIAEELTPTDRVRNIMREHLQGQVGFNVLEHITQVAMEALAEAKPIIAEIIDRERACLAQDN